MAYNSTHIQTNQLIFLQLLSSIIAFIVIYMTIFGNLLVIIAIWRTPKLRLKSNYLILSMSVTDLICGSIILPFVSYVYIHDLMDWTTGAFMCQFVTAVISVCATASSNHLLFIAIDRYLSVHRLEYSRSANKWPIVGMIAVSWILPLIINIYLTIGINDNKMFAKQIANQLCLAFSGELHYKLMTLIENIVPFAIISWAYYRIFQKSHEYRKKYDEKHRPIVVVADNLPDTNHPHKHQLIMRREFRVAKTVAIITVVYCLFTMPFTINPIIYTLFNREFRQAFKTIVRTPKLRRLKSNYLILSLSITDLIIGFTALPFSSYFVIIDLMHWTTGSFMCYFISSVVLVCGSASVNHLVFISIDRYLSVSRLNYSKSANKWPIVGMIVFSWSWPLVANIYPTIGFHDSRMQEELMAKQLCLPFSEELHYKILTSIEVIIPFTIMTWAYYMIYKVCMMMMVI
ncbi:5-hydroxytryptamine receptor 4-like [Oppia nitens]|uniref:5-hydroxytryptamine receptor 4-like n=1 Tax=Oppia nitens TaxID=1686743 RepID=UPI0023DB873C|nr:5-hydroxytryptamine receptor 4-like [Oppia nitens]